MPTGYTYRIEEGCTFEEYVWRCARGMGACIDMRDESMDANIPDEFPVDDHHMKKIWELEEELYDLDRMTDLEIQNTIDQETSQVIESNKLRLREHADKILKYREMREKVATWNPPTPDHVDFKNFMLSQIDDSIKWESEPYQSNLPIQNPSVYRQNKRSSITDEIQYHEKEYREDLERTNSRNEWIRQLRNSVPQP